MDIARRNSDLAAKAQGKSEFLVNPEEYGLPTRQKGQGIVTLPFQSAPERVQLNDGRIVSIRPIIPADLNALKAFFAALSPVTLRQRFHFSIREVPEHFLHQFTSIDGDSHVAFIAETCGTGEDPARSLVADARYVRYTSYDSAEFALVVADGWRSRGLGTALVRTLVRYARFAGLRHLSGDVLEDNKVMLGFAYSLGARSMPGTAGVDPVRLCLKV